jgi:AcrR family transcriptional regulator
MKAAEAKKRLVAESVRLIDEQGLGALSFREMSRRAGVSHQTPYHHFNNREGILAAIALEGFTRLDARLTEVRSRYRRKPPSEILRNLLRAYMNFAIENPVHYGVMFRPELVDFQRYPEALAQALLTFQRLVDTVAACHPAAASTDQWIIEIANALWAAAHGVATLWMDGPLGVNLPGLSIASFIDMTSDMFSQTGAKTNRIAHAKAKRGLQKRSDRFSDAKTTSSRTT